MTLRIASKRAIPSLYGRNAPIALNPAVRRRYASAATASNLSDELKQDIYKEASLPTADPPSDSATAHLVAEQAPFMVATYVRPPPMFVKGKGCHLWDVENRRYLDFTAGIAVNALGHCDPQMSYEIEQQARTLIHTSNLYHNPWTGALCRLLVEQTIAKKGMSTAHSAFICNSGSEANEAALKFARKVGKVDKPSGNKHEIVSFQNSFHGRTFGSLSATPNPKYQAPFAPMLPGFRYGTYNDIEELDALVTENTAGVIIEPIQGEGGVNVASPEFLQALRNRCNAVGAVLIYDEIQCGLSRTGMLWAHSSLPPSAHPDIITTAKALGNGYPIGATVVNGAVHDKIKTGDHGTTFGGNPLGARVAHSIFTRLCNIELQKSVVRKGEILRAHFATLQDRYPHLIRETRGKGLILGLQLTQDPSPILTAARERGLLLITCGTNTLRFVPPLIISDAEIEEGMAILGEAIKATFSKGEKIENTRQVGK